MSSFDDFISKAKSVATTAGRKTGEFIDVTKLKFKASEAEKDISSMFEGLGRLIYDAKKNDEDISELVDSCTEQIDTKYEVLADVRKEIDDLNYVLRCGKCGTSNSEDALFCKKCGHEIN